MNFANRIEKRKISLLGRKYGDTHDIPNLSVPSMMKGDIYLGKIVSGSKRFIVNGYKTPFDYRLSESGLMHTLFTGVARSGKSDVALRYVSGIANHVRRGPKKKRIRIVAMDPKEDWRRIARFVEPDRFRIYSMGDANKFPFKLNPLKVPLGVDPESHIDVFSEVFCSSYRLGSLSEMILILTLKTLYEKEGVFDTNNLREVNDRSGRITLAIVHDFIKRKKENNEFCSEYNLAVDKLLERLARYAWKNGVLYKLYCQPDGMSIEELLGEDDVVVLESGKMQLNNMTFIFGFITASIYMYGKHLPEHFLGSNEYETCLVVEEANRVLTGDEESNVSLMRQPIFDEMYEQAAGHGLFVFSITQVLSMISNSVLANSGLLFAGRMTIKDDIDSMMMAMGKEGRFEDRPIMKFFPKCPTGWFMCKSSRTFDYKESEPVLVAIDRLDVEKPSDQELKDIMTHRK